ncbi:cell division protein FtsQ/DivIB [Clostridium magnum]|uniref:Cell division protein DivIB n=1 Tax=Clostridium magnum DSM 2767 TaxID=1121326 RepID=A0A161XHM6_9CLOT|nr:FtsQ-type POTRA domain-containing protein [Clostridium magnum]KZL94176.1 cell division protein DivIB [Clostridium magnum DSM 2767]SHH93575.1 cell division protein FtsQ [Clostridium magnum DSM 2767]
MGKTTSKTDNELILRRRRKKKLQKTLLLFTLMISLCAILCLKLPYFNIKTIQVLGNKNISQSNIISLSKISTGNNIFYIDLKDSENNILSNPYIYSAEIIRKLPSTVQISVKEREAVFYNVKDNMNLVIDKNAIVLQQREDIRGMKLIKLDGLDYNKVELGKIINDADSRRVDVVKALGDIIESNKILGITSIDVSSSVDIKIYYGNILIKIGNEDDIDKKMNKALNMIERKEIKGAKGYIDVSFEGNPVFFIQN